jgi:hypothetical protein
VSSLVTYPETLLQYTIAKGSISHLRRYSMAKTKQELLMKHKLTSNELNVLAIDLHELLKIYDESTLSSMRKILIYRDLKLAQRFGLQNKVLIDVTQKLKKELLFDFRSINSLSNLVGTKSLRGIYRRLL